MFSAIGEKTLYIFGISNVITIPMVWALYPESNQRTLEEMDLLFAADTPWNWDAERNFAILKAENPDLVHAAKHHEGIIDVENGLVKRTSHKAGAKGLGAEQQQIEHSNAENSAYLGKS